jgi:hypothetical protein
MPLALSFSFDAHLSMYLYHTAPSLHNQIVKINGKEVLGLAMNQVLGLVKGAPGTMVSEREGERGRGGERERERERDLLIRSPSSNHAPSHCQKRNSENIDKLSLLRRCVCVCVHVCVHVCVCSILSFIYYHFRSR